MECDSVYCSDDGDYCDCLSSKLVIAKKECTCSECGGGIKKGEQYKKEVIKWEGLHTHRWCLPCLSTREVFFDNGYIYTQMWDDMHTHILKCGG